MSGLFAWETVSAAVECSWRRFQEVVGGHLKDVGGCWRQQEDAKSGRRLSEVVGGSYSLCTCCEKAN